MKKNKNKRKYKQRLANLRKRVDTVDRQLLEALAKRCHIVEKIGQIKADNEEPVLQKGRWLRLIKDRKRQGVKLDISPKLIHEIYDCIQKDSLKRQSRIKAKGKKR